MPKSINVGIFNETNPDSTKNLSGKKGEVYATLALTQLSPKNGLFIFLAGSHRRTPGSSPTIWRKFHANLSPGDALVWRGDLAYSHSPGGGGMFVTLVFEDVLRPVTIG
jgi:ectoine hydroxylase-related dioxygenase (phytanoyl-CoA dioxygenase family)